MRGLVDILKVSSKRRDDGYSDQYNRIFVIKILLVSSIITGVDYFSDSVNCMVPKTTEHDKAFFNTACWIAGFYIYEEMRDRLDESSYYGIPQRVDFDGIKEGTNELCHTQDQFKEVKDCKPMSRVYYLQYQWMPVYLIVLCCFYYSPYILFRMTNTDMASLRKDIKDAPATDTTLIIRNYFNYSINALHVLRVRVWGNLAVKLIYIFNGICAFYITDYVLLGRFAGYGTKYLRWHAQNNTLRHVVTFKSQQAQAGGELLPSMGFCDIHEMSLEARVAFHNKNKFICELSPHILYQYVLVVIWFFMVVGIVVATLGALCYIIATIMQFFPYGTSSVKRRLMKTLTLREIEYLELIKQKDIVKYGDVMRRLRDERFRQANSIIKDQEEGLSEEMELDKFIASLII